MSGIEKIGIIGTGLMGKGIAHVLAIGGFKVDVFGRRDDFSGEITEYFNYEESKGRINSQKKELILQNVNFFNLNTQAEKVSECQVIIETVKEDIVVKKEIFTSIKPYINAGALLASNTSSYLISRLAQYTPYPQNFIGLHFFSPVPLMKLVEVVEGKSTDESAVNTACTLVKSIDKLPVVVKDSPGFVLNRGLFVMINEAVTMLHEGIVGCSEDIDNIFINGMGLKVGPLKLADMVGIDVTLKVLENMYEETENNKYTPCVLLKTMFENGLLGKKAGEGFYSYKGR